ncbi:MAG TPA: PaaX family transcriptional regulator C-terminal domain-containing protein [Candidatus Acidoferrales bacterium]|nr:PaaX family transcriptional regulator C-terminal domain-containing protein [Candidatus Acidoferrales bacterium]
MQPAALTKRPLALGRLRPRSMLFTLFGDYVYPEGGEIGLGGLVRAGLALDMTETAVRSAVARLAREGWLRAERRGRSSFYRLSQAGRSLIEEGTRRIYNPDGRTWDGSWCLLTYSIPERQRSLRDQMRKELAWLGFGQLVSGVYLAAHDRGDEVRRLAKRVGVQAFARTFLARCIGATNDARLVEECWDLRAVGRAYDTFLRAYAPRFARDATRARRGRLDDKAAFVSRFFLTHDFRRFPFVDPDLPQRLLPKRWPGVRARRLFERYHAMLGDGALRFFSSCSRASSSG